MIDVDQAEPPLPSKDKPKEDKGRARKLGEILKPAYRGFSRIQGLFRQISAFFSPKLLYLGHSIKQAYFAFTKSTGLDKSIGYQLGLLIVLAMIPWISQASVSQEAYSDLMRYSEPLDPIQAGNFERNLTQYKSPGLYVDPDKVILAEMEKNESMSLQQQLAINANKNIDVPERQSPTYEVQNGETITEVAKKFDLHVGTILDANNLNPEDLKRIKPGTVLTIPSSDTNTSDSWIVAINAAEERARQEAAAKAAAEAARRRQQQVATTRVNTGGVYNRVQRGSGGSSNVTVIGYSSQQCVPWARENSGVQIRGYAGDVGATQSEPRVGGVALDRFYGHASVVVSVGDDYIVVHEANWIPGRITERTVSKAAIRGYVY